MLKNRGVEMTLLSEIMHMDAKRKRTQRLDERMHLGEKNPRKMTSRQIADHVFMDLIGLWIMSNIFDYAADAKDYADRTRRGAGGFAKWKTGKTDLYNSIHIVLRKRTDIYTSDADAILLERIKLRSSDVMSYLDRIAKGKANESFVRTMLQRIESNLNIEDSTLRSVRRIAQEWNGAQTSAKRLVLTRMVQFYNANARQCEMAFMIKKMAKSENLLDRKAKNAEKGSILKSFIAHGAAAATGAAIGYKFGRSLGG